MKFARLLVCAFVVSCTAPAPRAPNPPRPVSIAYLGVAGWVIADDAHTLLADPYFSRVHVDDGAADLTPDLPAIARYAPPHADVILVSHSHYDHLLDAPTIAKSTGATIVGTASTVNVARASGVSRVVLVHGGESLAFGPFSVKPIRALHSITGQAPANIPAGVTVPMTADAFAEGGTLQYLIGVEGRTILFIGTANFIESELEGLRPDVAIIAVGLREKVPDYSCRIMRALGQPGLVLANHFDAHRKPLGPEQMNIGDESRADLAHFADEVHSCSPQTKVVIPTHFEPIAI